MNDFTHHNTCINLLDVIVESDPVNFTSNPTLDTYNLLSARTGTVSLDDSVPILQEAKKTLSPKPKLQLFNLVHPQNLKFVPIALDDRSHLPSHLAS
jgi:hypothetical protein